MMNSNSDNECSEKKLSIKDFREIPSESASGKVAARQRERRMWVAEERVRRGQAGPGFTYVGAERHWAAIKLDLDGGAEIEHLLTEIYRVRIVFDKELSPGLKASAVDYVHEIDQELDNYLEGDSIEGPDDETVAQSEAKNAEMDWYVVRPQRQRGYNGDLYKTLKAAWNKRKPLPKPLAILTLWAEYLDTWEGAEVELMSVTRAHPDLRKFEYEKVQGEAMEGTLKALQNAIPRIAKRLEPPR